ncbi:MAG: undecaprenyl diphosphate synthase family protein [Acidilobaceae archaeon]
MIVRHIGIIPDGNRRWAKLHRTSLREAYERGLRVLERTVLNLFELPVSSVTIYALSYENCTARSREELEVLEEVIRLGFESLQKFVERNVVAVRVYGDESRLSEEIRNKIKELEEESPLSSFMLNIGLCYRCEPKTGYKRGELQQPVDLVIRTGGRSRLSGFFPIDSSYAEIYVTEKLWPDFTENDLEEAIMWFMKQKRNFGR